MIDYKGQTTKTQKSVNEIKQQTGDKFTPYDSYNYIVKHNKILVYKVHSSLYSYHQNANEIHP